MAKTTQNKRSKAEQALDYVMEHPLRVLLGGAVIGTGSWMIYRFGKGIFDKARRSSAEKDIDSSPAARQASVLRSAMNPSGISWMMSFDTTDTAKVLDTARSITNLDEVINAYRKLHASNLIEDLQSELSTEDYQKFMSLISTSPGKTGTPPVTYAKKNQLVVAKKEVNVRSSPDATSSNSWTNLSEKNILFTAKPGDFIGYATGKQEFDTKNNVKFIQVGYIMKKDGLPDNLKTFAGKSYSMWVSASTQHVDIYENFSPMFSHYPRTQQVVAYKKPLDYYSGTLKGLAGKVIVSAEYTTILDEKMQPLVKVEPDVLLGEMVQTLQTSKVTWYKFRTVDKKQRWVNANHVKMYNL
jgi:hypothetical protein